MAYVALGINPRSIIVFFNAVYVKGIRASLKISVTSNITRMSYNIPHMMLYNHAMNVHASRIEHRDLWNPSWLELEVAPFRAAHQLLARRG